MISSKSSKYLYRIIRFERLVQMLNTDEWYFAHPRAWEDPYEVKTKNSLSDVLFAQCWCRNGVSDAMWRIYSHDNTGLRIRISEKELQSALANLVIPEDIGFKIAKVKYVNERQYAAITAKTLLELEQNVTFTRASAHLFLKRPAFAHEEETRVVITDFKLPIDAKPDGIKIKLDTRKLIQSVLVDPRAPSELVEAYKHYLKDVLQFQGTVKQSLLYKSDEVREL